MTSYAETGKEMKRFERAGIPKQGFDNYIVLLVTVKC
jgi:hypothetical protein